MHKYLFICFLLLASSATWASDSSNDFVKLKQQAEQGDARAQYVMGRLFEKGQQVEKDQAEAIRWYFLSAEQGFAAAQFTLGLFYKYGEDGLEQDDEQSLKWYLLAAEQGNKHAQMEVARFYNSQNNIVEAVKWYTLVAEHNEANPLYHLDETEALSNLGFVYLHGYGGIAQDKQKAMELYGKAKKLFRIDCEEGLESACHKYQQLIDRGF